MSDELIKTINSHHAILLEGDNILAFKVRDFLKEENDIFFIEKAEINIEDARSIKENAILKPAFGDFRIVIISANKLGREAEQSLLKILEEPPKETKIIIITPNPKVISPTILSRVVKIKDSFREIDEEVLSYLKKDSVTKLKMVETILKDENKNLLSFFDQIEILVDQKGLTQNKDWRESLLDIYEAKKALQIPGTSKKQILEYISLTLPKF